MDPTVVAQVPAAIAAHAFGARRSIHSQVVMGWPVLWFVPKDAQYPSFLFCSLGIEPSTTRMKGLSLPLAAWSGAVSSETWDSCRRLRADDL